MLQCVRERLSSFLVVNLANCLICNVSKFPLGTRRLSYGTLGLHCGTFFKCPASRDSLAEHAGLSYGTLFWRPEVLCLVILLEWPRGFLTSALTGSRNFITGRFATSTSSFLVFCNVSNFLFLSKWNC